MKKYIPLTMAVFLIIISLIFVFACFANSFIIQYNDIIVFLCCIVFAVLTAKSKKKKYITKLVVLILLNLSVMMYVGINAMFSTREFHIQSGNDAVNEFESALFNENAENSAFKPFENINKNYEAAELYEYRFYSLFSHRAHILVLKYSDSVFSEAEKYIEDSYVFYEKPIIEGEPLPIFEFDGFQFRHPNISCLSLQDPTTQYYTRYPNFVYLIGINYSTNEISYIIFNDNDLGRITSFSEFVFNDCGWKYIERSQKNIFFNMFYSD